MTPTPANRPTDSRSGEGRLLGVVLDSTTHQPVLFATVALLDAASGKLKSGTTADEQGRFELTSPVAGTYWLRVSLVGYQTRLITLRVPVGQPVVDLGQVRLLAQVQTLRTVEVVGRQALLETKDDRLVYNAEKDVTVQGGNATDILRKVPLLTVDLDGNLSLRGSPNVRILINNKPSALLTGSVGDALKQLPADQIKAIEVITSPSARYDGEGSAGVINIVLKKNTLPGFTFGLEGGLGNRGGSVSLNSGLRRGKMGVSLGGSGWLNYNIRGAFVNEQTTAGTTVRQQADTRSRAQAGQYTFGWDYDLSKTNTLATSVRFGLRNNDATLDRLTTEWVNPGSSAPPDLRTVLTQDLSRSVDINTTYTHVFKPKQEFSLLTLFSQNDRINQFTASELSWTDPARVLGRERNDNPSLNREIALQADYQTTLGRGSQVASRPEQLLEVGLKVIVRQVNSDFANLRDSSGGGDFGINELYPPNGLRYRQNVLAAYGSYTLPLPKQYTLNMGVRYERTTLRARYQPGADSTAPPLALPAYGNWLPSVTFSKSLKGGTMLKLTYNHRLQRPGIQFLNPNVTIANPLLVLQGNPLVGPELTQTIELSTGATIKTVYLNVALFARFARQAIQPVRDTVASAFALDGRSVAATAIRTSYQNIGQEKTHGLNLTATGTLLPGWQLGGGLDVYAVRLSSRSAPLALTNTGWVAAGRLFSSVVFKKGWSLQGFGLLLARQVQLQGYQGGFSFYMLGLKKEFANKRGSVGLAAENFLNHPFRVTSELVSPSLTQYALTSYYNAGVRITGSFRIGKSSDATPPARRAINNDDVKGGSEKIDKQ